MAQKPHFSHTLVVLACTFVGLLLIGLLCFIYLATHQPSHHHIYKISTVQINHSKFSKYGHVKYNQKNNTLIYTAKPYVAKQIKHAKIGDTLPGKFSTLADHDTNHVRKQYHDKALKEQLLPDT